MHEELIDENTRISVKFGVADDMYSPKFCSA
jgi:hypothetical protein